jgi:hypothetical protein
MIRLAIPTGVFRKSARTLNKGPAAPMANNRRDDYPALTDPFGYAGEVELFEATLRPRSKGLILRGTSRTEDSATRKNPPNVGLSEGKLLHSRARLGAVASGSPRNWSVWWPDIHFVIR